LAELISRLELRSDHCQYCKSIVYVTCTVDFQYWQYWLSERSPDQ